MRVAILSDIHGNLPALEAVWADLKVISPDLILCAGDLVDYGPHPNEVIDFIKDMQIPCVIGNHDQAVGQEIPVEQLKIAPGRNLQVERTAYQWTVDQVSASSKKYLLELPFELRQTVERFKLLVVHASPRSVNEYLRPDTHRTIYEEVAANCPADLVAFGHIHKTFVKSSNSVLFVNSGSVGRPKDGRPRAAYAYLDFNKHIYVGFRKIEYPVEKTVRDIIIRGLPRELADDLRLAKAK